MGRPKKTTSTVRGKFSREDVDCIVYFLSFVVESKNNADINDRLNPLLRAIRHSREKFCSDFQLDERRSMRRKAIAEIAGLYAQHGNPSKVPPASLVSFIAVHLATMTQYESVIRDRMIQILQRDRCDLEVDTKDFDQSDADATENFHDSLAKTGSVGSAAINISAALDLDDSNPLNQSAFGHSYFRKVEGVNLTTKHRMALLHNAEILAFMRQEIFCLPEAPQSLPAEP